MISIKEFCEKHKAPKNWTNWAIETCKDMQEVWNTSNPEQMIWIATREGVLSEKELRLFACWCARTVAHLMKDNRSRHALGVLENYIEGEANEDALTDAVAFADAAADNAGVAWSIEAAAALTIAWACAWDSNTAASGAVGWSASALRGTDAIAAQAKYLIENCTPDFEESTE